MRKTRRLWWINFSIGQFIDGKKILRVKHHARCSVNSPVTAAIRDVVNRFSQQFLVFFIELDHMIILIIIIIILEILVT